MTVKEHIADAGQLLTLAAFAVRKAKTDPANRDNWLKDAAAHTAAASKAIKAAQPAPVKKAEPKKAAPKKAKK